MTEYKELWEEFYRDGKYAMLYPDESTIKFFGRLKKEINLEGLKALDFGCGVGRNLKFMDELGMDVYGLEISEEAKRYCWMQGYKCQTYDGKKIPFPDEFFDVIISYGVLDHMKYVDAFLLFNELHRVLKRSGKMLIVLHSIYDSNFGKGKEIGRNVYINDYGKFEVGIPQQYYSLEDCYSLMLFGFKLERYNLHENQNFVNNSYSKDSFWELYLRK